MFNVNNIEINAAFYELYEVAFDEDFFEILAKLRPSNRIKALKEKNVDELTQEEAQEVLTYNTQAGLKMQKITPKIAYIGTKLKFKNYSVSYKDYLMFLGEYEFGYFLNKEISAEIWKKIQLDQALPKSVKNA